ncbi:hypothetical protein A6R68_21919, partial [Neotoma lepida]
PKSQKQWSTSFIPQTATLSTLNNIPWIASIDKTCQGIILNQWWILSTISCLTKLKYLNSDISRVVNKEGILHGDKICLHPSFNPSDGKYPIKGVIGAFFLEFPIRKKEISLPQTYNIFRESCFHCVYRHCSVYQYQKHTKFENNMKKLSVKVLDISFCHHQYNHMTKSNNLCIWSHQKEDCWIQQGSPVLCTFGSHWELVGLVSESSMACDSPILVIKTAPYLSWIRWLIKMNEKPLDSFFSPLCSFYPGVEYDLISKIKILTNSMLNDHGSQYSSITPKLDPVFNEAWYLVRSQRTSTKTDGYMISPVPMTILHSPTLTIPYYWPLSKSIAFISWSHYKPSHVIPSSQLDTTNLLSKHEATMVKPPKQTEDTAWLLFHSNIIKPLVYSKINIIRPWTQTDSNLLKLWTLSETESVKYLHTLKADKIRLWLDKKPVENNVVWFQVQTRRIGSQSESLKNHVLFKKKDEKILSMYQSQIDTFKTWNQTKLQIMPSWTKHDDDKARLWTQIPEASDKLFHNEIETALKQTQSLTQSARNWILPETETCKLWKPPMADKLRNWVHHEFHTVKSLIELNDDIVKPRVHKEARTLTQWMQAEFSKVNPHTPFETDIVIVWTQVETPVVNGWLDFLEDTATIWIHSQFQELKDLTQSENDRVTKWTQTEAQPSSPWTLSEVDTFTPWTPGESSNLIPLIDPVIYTLPSWTQNEPTKKSKTIADTLTYWAQTKMSTTSLGRKLLRNKPISGPKAEERNNLALSESYSPSLWTKAHYSKVNSSDFKSKIGTIWASYEYPTLHLWKQTEVDIMAQWTCIQSQLETSWSHQLSDTTIFNHANSPLFIHLMNPDCDIITALFQKKTQPVNSYNPPRESVTPWTQYEASENNLQSETRSDIDIQWIQTAISRGSPMTQAKVISEVALDNTETVNRWTQTTDDFKKTWSKDRLLALTSFTEMAMDIFTLLIQTKSPTTNLWTHLLSDKITLWIQPIYPTGSQQAGSIASTATVWLKSNSPLSLDNSLATKVSGQLISDVFILSSIRVPLPKVNLFGFLISDTIILSWSQYIYSPVNRGRLSGTNKIAPLWPKTKFSQANIKTSSVSDIIMPHWPQEESSEVNRWPWSFPDTVTPTWTQIGSPNLSLMALIDSNTESSTASPSRNILSNHSADIITQPWTHSRPPIFSVWILPVSVTISPLHQTESIAGNLWPLHLYDTVTPMWIHSGSQPVYLWTLLQSNTITSTWSLPEPLQAKLWTLPIFNRTKPVWLQTEYKKLNTGTWFMSDAYILPWTLSKHKTLIPLTGKIANELSQRAKSEVLIVNSWTQFASDTIQNQAQTPEVKHLISDPVLLRNQATSPTAYFGGKYEAVTFTEWANSQFTNVKHKTQSISNILRHAEISITDPWIKVETDISQMSQANSRILNLWTHPSENTVTSLFQSVSIIFIPWTKFQPNAIRMRTQADSSVLTHWTQSISDRVTLWSPTLLGAENPTLEVRGTETLWKIAEIIVLKSWNQSATDIVSQWITDKSSAIHVFPTTIFDKILLFDQPVSQLLTQWTQTETEAVIWREAKSFKKHVQTNSHHNIVTKWGPSEFSDEMVWTAPKAGTVVVWQQDISKFFIPRIEDTAKVVKPTTWTIPSIVIPWTQKEFPPEDTWTGYSAPKDIHWIQEESALEHSDTVSLSSTVISWMQPEHVPVVPWTQLIDLRYKLINTWMLPSYNHIIWTHPEYSDVIIPTSSLSETLTPLKWDESQLKNHWAQSVPDKVIPWTQVLSISKKLWREGSLLSWRVPVLLADDHWHHHEYYISGNWFKTKDENIRPWTQPYFQTINVYTSLRASKVESWVQHKMDIKSWMNSATGIFNDWTKSETENIILGNVPKNNTVRPSSQVEASINHIWFQLITNTIRVLPQAESQVISFLTQSVSDILLLQPEKEPETYLYMSDNSAVSSWFQIQKSLRQRNKLEPETVTPWIQQEWHIAHPWNRLETKVLKTRYNSEADTSQILLTYSKSDEIKPRTQLESLLVRRWPEDAIVTLWPLTKSDTIMPWSQLEYKTTQYLAQPNFGRINPWIQYEVSTETLEIIPWTHSAMVLSHSLQTPIESTLWPLTQSDAIRLWSQVEYETTQSLAQTNVGRINPWIQHKDSIETLDINSCTYFHKLIACSLQTQIYSFTLWNQLRSMTAQALTAVVTVSPSLEVQETLSSDEPTLVSPSKSVPQDKRLLEPLSLRPSKLNVSLAECHLKCGLRPGLVPYCPNCWEAEIGEFPWMVSVQLSYSHFCAGSILNENWILTSARCANLIKRSESLALVQVGLLDLQDPSQGEIVGIHRSIPYLGPRGPLGPGLIFLKEPIHFQPLVLPICLEESQEQERHIQLYDCWLPSWSLMRGSPGILQKRHLSIMQVSTCAKYWPQLNEFTFCVEARKAMGESGCKGDLGAPLVCHLKQKDTWVQVGILIHFDEHCEKPYVFSQVSPFVFWLQGVTHPSHAPWSFQRPVATSFFNSLSISARRKAPIFTSQTAVIHPHFISLPHPQALADHISLQYTMPWQAMIFSCGNQICSGSIISSYWILTAAHCVRNMNPEDTVVILGLRHPGTSLRVVKVTTILLHERFRLVSQTARNDLALVLLQEVQNSIHIVAPLGNMKNLNTSECWLSGPQILKQGDILENPEMLQIQVMGASNCAYLYPDIGSSTVCYIAQARGPEINMESVSPGSAVMCRPLSGNGKWTQIGFTSLKHLAT